VQIAAAAAAFVQHRGDARKRRHRRERRPPVGSLSGLLRSSAFPRADNSLYPRGERRDVALELPRDGRE
jgi:hypothetical protein